MKAPFGKGDAVICIRDANLAKPFPARKGNIYFVRECFSMIRDDHFVVRLSGIFWGQADAVMHADRFRLYNPPPQEKTTIDNKAKVGHDA